MPYLAAFKALPWKLIGIGAAIMAFGLLFATLRLEQAHSAKLKVQIEKCADARKADRALYERAQIDAKAKNIAEVKAIEARQRGITDEVSRDLSTRLERLRRELRPQAAPAGGVAGHAGSPASGQAAAGADGEARVCFAPSDLLRAAESEERHDQLITWLEKQLAAQ